MTNNHTKQETPKRRIQNPVKHLRSSFFPKIVSGFQPLTICRKKLYLRCSTGFWIRLFKKKHSHKRINCTFFKRISKILMRLNVLIFGKFSASTQQTHTWIPRWNDVETVVSSTSFQREIHEVCFQGMFLFCSYFLWSILTC